MYNPQHFVQSDPQALQQLIRQFPLGTLICQGSEGLEVHHIPFLLDAGADTPGTLRGHLALANPLWKRVGASQSVIVVFQGPEAYISPSHYATKAEHGRVVPTWNYAVAHVHGHLRVVEDKHWLRQQVSDLTHAHEHLRPHPWSLSDAPADYLEKMLAAIKGIEISIERIEGKWKASQNQPAANQLSLAAGLAEENPAMAALVLSTNGHPPGV